MTPGTTAGAQTFPVPSHVALVHNGETERRAGVREFLIPAADDPNAAIYLCGPPGEARRLFASLEEDTGRDLHPDLKRGRILLGQGDRDVDQQLRNLLDAIRLLFDRGFARVRVAGPAAWDVPGYAAPEDFLWYESRILPALEGVDAVILCTYDAAQLPAVAIQYGAVETHSHILISGVLSENAAFLPAERYLRERLVNLSWLNLPGAEG